MRSSDPASRSPRVAPDTANGAGTAASDVAKTPFDIESGPFEIETAKPDEAAAFWRSNDRDWRSELWNFRVVWHEQSHDVVAKDGDRIVAALHVRLAASLAHIEALYVLPAVRKQGLGRMLVARTEEVANYYNCHKMSVATFAEHPAQAFFERCGYKTEAILAQHTFKLDVAMLRKFLL